jgi:hypothetical protein
MSHHFGRKVFSYYLFSILGKSSSQFYNLVCIYLKILQQNIKFNGTKKPKICNFKIIFDANYDSYASKF